MIATMFLVAATITVDDAAIQEFVDSCESRLPSVLDQWKQELKRPATTLPNNVFPTPQAKKEFINRNKQRIESAKENIKRLESKEVSCLELCTPQLDGQLEVGRVRYAPNSAAIVLQVIDSENVLLQWGRSGSIWLSGVSTAGLTDGATTSWPTWVEVVGTQTYDSAIGSRTVFKLRPFDIEPARKLWSERHPGRNSKQ